MGLVLGAGLSMVFAVMGDGRMRAGQVLMAGYFAMSLLLVLRGVDAVATWVTIRLLRRGTEGREGLGAWGQMVRGTAVVCVCLPWVMAAVMIYRPKVSPAFDPLQQAGWAFQSVEFGAMDGLLVSGWWIPGAVGTGKVTGRTVVVAHGLGSNKGNQLLLARRLVPAGFNVLAIDLRAHGDSGGQLATLGIRERFDVLGAVRWLKREQANGAGRVYALGASLGGAAVLAAATEGTPEADAIEAVVVYGTYANLGDLMNETARDRFPGPMGWLLKWIGFPLAELHSGERLRHFDIAGRMTRLWPRPVMIVHGTKDEFISIAHGRKLFRDASLPKDAIWVPEGTHNSIVGDEGAAAAVEAFLRGARSEPVVQR